MEKADLYTMYLCGVITESQYLDAVDKLLEEASKTEES
jgi:hypothetical protein